MEFKRKQRVAELIKIIVSQIIQRDYAGSMPALVTIMSVEVSDDLKYAKLFISFYGSDDNKERSSEYLKRNIKKIRWQLGGSLKLRQIPFLTVVEDSSLDKAFRIEELLTRVQDEENEPDSDG